MTLYEATLILEAYNEWRRGAEMPHPHPRVIGESIDIILEHLRTTNRAQPAIPERGLTGRT
jgi:hypothetical protein